MIESHDSPHAPLPTPDTSYLPDGHALRARFAILAAELAASPTADERERLKAEIIALFKDADAAVAQYAAFKESVKGLVTQWKALDGKHDTPPASHNGARAAVSTPISTAIVRDGGQHAVSARVDHLGASTFIEKGWSKLSLGDPAGAEVALRKALDLSPGDADTETLLGWSLMMQQQYDAALVVFHAVLMRHPDHALARTNVGYVCLRKQLFGEAIEHLSGAIRLDSDHKATLYAHLYLGMVYHEREMYEDAELFFTRALELGPNLLQAWYELGRTRWYAGRIEDAIGAWREGAEANKFNPWGKRCSEMLLNVLQGGSPPRSE